MNNSLVQEMIQFSILRCKLNCNASENVLDPVEADLKDVSVFFDTPTFDRIKKDRAAKFVDMLSAIGGTMGLLTGFSIISGIEILYFSVMIIFDFMKKFKNSLF